jgi:GT2 family glycosyltransferase
LKTLAITVNYKSRDLTFQAVQSILDSASLGPVQVVVVDNSDDKDEAERLRQGLSPGVALLLSPKNIGFGCACNLAFEHFEGDQILLLNPDAKLLPDCLLRLQKTLLSSNDIAAVSPQIFWDDGLKYYLPPASPTIIFEFQAFLDSWGPQSPICRLLSALWRYHSIKVWRSKKPIKVNNLSGGLVLMKRDAVLKAGGLFDPRFFLYFEDTDLFIRLRKTGFILLVEPRAKAIHYYDQCGREEWERKRAMMAESYRIFLTKHWNGWKSGIKKVAEHIRSQAQIDGHHIPGPRFFSPFVLAVPPCLHDGWLFEVSPSPAFTPSAGRFGEGPLVDFTEEYWSMLAAGQYFGRLGAPARFRGCSEVISWMITP